ncbi:MAG: hypothetical protein R3E31_30510 [Chloroflexota bacterium]
MSSSLKGTRDARFTTNGGGQVNVNGRSPGANLRRRWLGIVRQGRWRCATDPTRQPVAPRWLARASGGGGGLRDYRLSAGEIYARCAAGEWHSVAANARQPGRLCQLPSQRHLTGARCHHPSRHCAFAPGMAAANRYPQPSTCQVSHKCMAGPGALMYLAVAVVHPHICGSMGSTRRRYWLGPICSTSAGVEVVAYFRRR